MKIQRSNPKVKHMITVRLHSSTAPFPFSIREKMKALKRTGYKVHKYSKILTQEWYPSGLPAYKHVVVFTR